MKPPTSILVIAWLFIVTSVLSIGVNLVHLRDPQMQELMARQPIPMWGQYGLTFVGLVINIIAGAGMLKGYAWSRMLFIGWSVLATIISAITTPMKVALIPGLVVLAVVAFFLYRPKANAWFAGRAAPAS